MTPERERPQALTQEGFDGLLKRLGTGEETAGREYENLRTRLIAFFDLADTPTGGGDFVVNFDATWNLRF